jgi:hypothetical protein
MKHLGWAAVLTLIGLAACRPASNPNMVVWERSPETVVFRADVVGGEQDEVQALNEVPRCTIYGDNLVVWVNELGMFERQVLVDRVPDAAIARFVEYLAVAERIYTYNQPVITQEADAQPVIETITLFVNGVEHRATSLSGWDQHWFQRVVNACANISQTPVLYEPEGGWLRAVESEYNINAPTSAWLPSETGLRLSDAAAEPLWIEGENARAIWRLLHTSPPNLLVVELDGAGARYFRLVLQVPGITRAAPPRPSSEGA